MKRINLLADRAARDLQVARPRASELTGKINALFGGLLVATVLGISGWWFYVSSTIGEMAEQVSALEEESRQYQDITRQVEQIKQTRDTLDTKVDIIKGLKDSQKTPIRVFTVVSNQLPELVWLEKMTLKQSTLQISGRSMSAEAIVSFVRGLKEERSVFEQVELHKASQSGDHWVFNLTCQVLPEGFAT